MSEEVYETNNLDVLTALRCCGHNIKSGRIDTKKGDVVVQMVRGEGCNSLTEDRIAFQNNQLTGNIKDILKIYKDIKDFVFDVRRNPQ